MLWNSLRNGDYKKNSLGLVVILFLLFVGIVLLNNIDKVQDWRRSAAGLRKDATLYLTQVPIDDEFFNVVVSFVTSSNDPAVAPNDIYGADLILQFDPAVLQVIQIDPMSANPGCNVGTPEVPLMFVPINAVDDCPFIISTVRGDANLDGELEFGVIAYDWTRVNESGYQPDPISGGGTPVKIATIRFRRIAEGGSIIVFKQRPESSTTDTNVAGVDGSDILASVIPVDGLSVGGGTLGEDNCIVNDYGDANRDEIVNLADVIVLKSDFMKSVPELDYTQIHADFDCSDMVDLADVIILKTWFMKNILTPTP